MQIDPMENWRQLTRHYAAMSDGELLALGEDFRDLTDTARQVLRDEMRRRNLGDPQASASIPSAADAQGNSFGVLAGETNSIGAGGDGASTHELAWKEVLYRCNDSETAWQISEVLRRAGIESWTDESHKYTPMPETDLEPRFRVLVASEQLDAARAVLVHPIPPDVIAESKEEDVYQPPVCPGCGAPDPVLEAVDPANWWKCEVCGREWAETLEETGRSPQPR